MKSLGDFLTPEQKEYFKNWYVCDDSRIIKLVDNEPDELTPEKFTLIYLTDVFQEEAFYIATVDDITFFDPETDDFDFHIGDDSDFFYRDGTPEEVLKFLDEYLNIAQYKKEE